MPQIGGDAVDDIAETVYVVYTGVHANNLSVSNNRRGMKDVGGRQYLGDRRWREDEYR